ncbi:MAG: ArsR/SmtB family transcription factor [Anaerolineales bacterium]|jgi:ArsR family transcriptional regulator
MSAVEKQTSPIDFARALADPTRQKIMKLICCKWLTVSEIEEAVDVRQPTVSHHLAVLRDAGLVHLRSEGKHTYYSLNQSRVAVCCGNLIQALAPETESASLLQDISKM